MKPSCLKIIGICSLFVAIMSITRPASAQQTSNFTSIREQSMSKLLGWIDDPKADNLCHGYYRANNISFPSYLGQNKTLIRSKSATYYTDKPTVLHDVQVIQPGRKITADQASRLFNTKSWQSNLVNLWGHIHLYESGILAIADKALINIETNAATLHTVTYRLSSDYVTDGRLSDQPKSVTKKTYDISGITARGQADRISQVEPKIVNLYEADYSTCAPDNTIWRVKASRINLDRNEGVGTAINARLYILDVPVFYFPYFNFPIDLKRKSGFLYPSFGTSSSSGYELSLPYYLNLAPDYDATITPNIFTDRGTQMNTLFRYLSWRRLGQLYFSILPHDDAFRRFKANAQTAPDYLSQPGYQRLENASDNRAYLAWQDQDIINPHWTSLLNLNYVSDDYYFQDFGNNPNTVMQNQMLQLGNLNYDATHWHMAAAIQNYQTLHPVNNTAIIPDQYTRFPQIDFNADYPHRNSFDYQLDGEFTNFRFPFLTQHYQANLPTVIGERYNVKPGISLPLYSTYGHFTPTLAFDATDYKLTDRAPNQPTEINRGLPMFDLDTGLYYQRPFSAFKNNYYQTFEPRLYYLYVPHREQDDIPLFDTSLQTFTYDSIFQNNRFTGIDRIGDADQLGYGISSHFINRTTGLDRFDASLGQIAYFRTREVNIPGEDLTSDTNVLSPLVGQLRFQFFNHWFATANAAWENAGNYVSNGSLNLEYILDDQHVTSVGYNFLRDGDPLPNNPEPNSARNNLNQIHVSEAWKLNYRWSLYSSINYNISHHYTQTYLYGLAFHNCCWAVRFVGTKSFIGLDTHNQPNYDSGMAIQIALTGLSNVGNSNPGGLLASNIPGYQDRFGKDKLPAAQPYEA